MYDFQRHQNIQESFLDFTEGPSRHQISRERLDALIENPRFDDFCRDYEVIIEKAIYLSLEKDIAVDYSLDDRFSEILQKNLDRLLQLTGGKVPCDSTLCDLLERSLSEVIRI